jgi:hypothetical protein
VELGTQAHMEATMVLSNIITMLELMDKPTAMRLQVTKAIQVTGTRRHAGIPQLPVAFTTTDQTEPTLRACTGLLPRTGSLRMRTCPLHQLVRSLHARDHTQRLSPNLPVPDQDHRLLQLSRASMLVYHSLYQQSPQTLRHLRPRSLESTISSA